MEKVLLTDCWHRKSLATVRALGIQNIEVHASGHKTFSPERFSKYTKKFFATPNPQTHPEEFKKKVIALLKANKYQCLMPLEEKTIALLYDIRDEIEKYTTYPSPPREIYETAYDKWKTIQLAKKLKIPTPESYCPQTDREVAKAIKKLKFPLIIKPRKTSGGRGLKKVKTLKQFNQFYPKIVKEFGRPIIQENIEESGQGVLVWAIIDKGKTVADFSYKRLREFPIGAGPGTLWESTNHEQIKEYCEKISKALNWHGIIMAEFKMDPKDNKPKIMEINPRLGGSIAHPSNCGINFPYLIYKLSKKEKIVKPEYKIGIRTRWLLPGDMLHFITNKNRWKMKPSFFDFFDKNTYLDQFKLNDLRGTFSAIAYTIIGVFDIEMWKKGVFR